MLDQKVYTKCIKNGIKCNETFKMLKKAFRDNIVLQLQVYELYKRFQKGRKDIKVDATCTSPNTFINDKTLKKIKHVALANRRITIREFYEGIIISYGSYEAIFTNALYMKRARAKFVPKLRSFQQKQHCVMTSLMILTSLKAL